METSLLSDQLKQFESGKLSFENTVNMFQHLADSGKIINMKNDYYASMNRLIDLGHIVLK